MTSALHVDALPLGGLIIGPFAGCGCVGELGELRGAASAEYIDVGDEKLAHIMSLIRDGSYDPTVIEMARRIVSEVPDKDHVGEVRAIWQWLRDNVRYVRDPIGMEVLQTAARMLEPRSLLPDELSRRLPPPARNGDCDEMGAILAGAMLRAIGYPVRIALWAKPRGPWRHIFTLAHTPKGWVVVDPTEKKRPFGWLPPMGRWTAHRFDDDAEADRRILGSDQLLDGVELADLARNLLEGARLADVERRLQRGEKLDGFFDDLWKGIQQTAGKVWDGVKQALPAIATVGASLIPGVGSVAAPIVGNLVNSLVNKGAENPAIAKAAAAMQGGANPIQAIGTAVGDNVPLIGQYAQAALKQFLPSGMQQVTSSADYLRLTHGKAEPVSPQQAAQQYAEQYARATQGAMSPQQAAQQYAQYYATASAHMAPAMADGLMRAQQPVRALEPQPQPGQFFPMFAAQARQDFPPDVLRWSPPAYPPPQPLVVQHQPAPQYGPPVSPQWPSPAQWPPAPPPQQRPVFQQAQLRPGVQPALPWYALPAAAQPASPMPPWYAQPEAAQPASPWVMGPSGPVYAPGYAGLLDEVFGDRERIEGAAQLATAINSDQAGELGAIPLIPAIVIAGRWLVGKAVQAGKAVATRLPEAAATAVASAAVDELDNVIEQAIDNYFAPKPTFADWRAVIDRWFQPARSGLKPAGPASAKTPAAKAKTKRNRGSRSGSNKGRRK